MIRFFEAKQNVPTSQTTSPDSNSSTSYWKEDFVQYPEFDKAGSYKAGDIVYFDMSNGTIRFYQALENIQDWTLNRFRENHSSGSTWAYPSSNSNYDAPRLTKHLNNSCLLYTSPSPRDRG